MTALDVPLYHRGCSEMQDDFRTHLDTGDDGIARKMLHDLGDHTAGHAGAALGDAVAVTHSEGVVFAYADSLEHARASAQVLEELASAHGVSEPATVARWHPEEERWEPAETPMPSTPEEHAAEQARLEALDVADGVDWELRVDLPSHGETVALAERLTGEGYAVKRRWRFLFIALATEHEAQELADRLEAELPEEATAEIVGSEASAVAWKRLHPFGWLGGLGN
jgi:hypothetical protein